MLSYAGTPWSQFRCRSTVKFPFNKGQPVRNTHKHTDDTFLSALHLFYMYNEQ